MAGVLRWVAPVAACSLIVMAAVGLGTGNPAGIEYDTSPVAPPPQPPVPERGPPPAAPPEVLFTGFIAVADPTRELMGPEPWLWSESCERLDIDAGRYDAARANLTAGGSEGRLEDLDLYAYDADGSRIDAAANETHGIGTHHAFDLDPAVVRLVVCLAGGSHASYEVAVA